MESVCIRCGKVRILSKKWKERAENKGAVITYENYVCPDAECQRLVEAKFEEMRARRLKTEEARSSIKIGKAKVSQ